MEEGKYGHEELIPSISLDYGQEDTRGKKTNNSTNNVSETLRSAEERAEKHKPDARTHAHAYTSKCLCGDKNKGIGCQAKTTGKRVGSKCKVQGAIVWRIGGDTKVYALQCRSAHVLDGSGRLYIVFWPLETGSYKT